MDLRVQTKSGSFLHFGGLTSEVASSQESKFLSWETKRDISLGFFHCEYTSDRSDIGWFPFNQIGFLIVFCLEGALGVNMGLLSKRKIINRKNWVTLSEMPKGPWPGL